MIADSVYFKGHRCFINHFSGFEEIKPINVIIGRNNSGKSQLLDLVSAICEAKFNRGDWLYKFSGVLDEASLERQFSKSTSNGPLPGNWWQNHGSHFINAKVDWEADSSGRTTSVELREVKEQHPYVTQVNFKDARYEKLVEVLNKPSHFLKGRIFRHLLADRDLQSEPADNNLALKSDGSGATNIIRRYITTSNDRYPRSVIQTELLRALNTIFSGDGRFSEIQVRIHDEPGESGQRQGYWEVYLGESKKGLIALSKSGSGLKTVILVLLNLFVVPAFSGQRRDKHVFAFEELENNLHPSLLRRLFQFIESYAVKEQTPVFITTHSSVALDFFGLSENAQIIHVKHDGESGSATVVQAHFDKCGVISELGAKPSDLLQANGVVWVEGPSDRIYINRWIDLFSNGELKEGKDYQCAFYSGALLARTEFVSPDEEEREINRVNLLQLNPNIIVVCDGDRSSGGRIKDRVRRIKAEVTKIPRSHHWITLGREIENYVPGEIIGDVVGMTNIPDPGQFEHFFPKKRITSPSFIEQHLNLKSLDKVQFAIDCVERMDMRNMQSRFDWYAEMMAIVVQIREWNK